MDVPSFAVPELRYVDAGGLRLAWRECGAGAPVVFLHGIGSASQAWEAQLAHFGESGRAIAWDAPGYGGSGDLPGEAPAAGDYAGALAHLLDHLGIERTVLVGNSLGALMAAAFVRRWPARVVALVLSDVAAGHARLAPEERAARLDGRLGDLAELGAVRMAEKRARNLVGPDADPATILKAQLVMQRIRPEGYAQAARMLGNGDVFAELEGCRTPTLVMVGSEDRVTPPAVNRSVADAVPGARYIEIEGVGHLPYLEAPGRFNAEVAAFLATVPMEPA